jgi:hypothetical protein
MIASSVDCLREMYICRVLALAVEMKKVHQNLRHACFSHPDGVSGLLFEMEIKRRSQDTDQMIGNSGNISVLILLMRRLL